MTNVIKLDEVREDRQKVVDEHTDMVIYSTIDYIRGVTEASPVLSSADIIRGVWMGLSSELFPQHYVDGDPQAEEVVMQILHDIADLVESTDEKRRGESTTH